MVSICGSTASAADAPRCAGFEGELPSALADQVGKLDALSQSLQEMISSAEAAQKDIDRAIAGGNTQPVIFERQGVIAAHERRLRRQIKEIEVLRERLCTAAREAGQ
jgi:hypothetical protein